MKRLALGVILTIVALAGPAVGQSPKPLFPLYGYIDSPSGVVYNTYGPDFHIAGWSFDCRTGQQPPFVAVLHGDFDAVPKRYTWITDYTVRRELARPDVRAAYAPFCPGLTERVGFAVYPQIPLTPGRHKFTVFWTDAENGLSRSSGVWVLVP